MYTIESLAQNKNYAQNKPRDFWWNGQPDWDESNTFLYHYVNRDSDILTESNADYIEKALRRFPESVVQWQDFNHFACGWVKAVAIKIRTNSGKFTKAFETMYDILERLDNYPVLDEEDFSNREMQAQYESIKSIVNDWLFDNDLELSEDQTEAIVYNLCHDSPDFTWTPKSDDILDEYESMIYLKTCPIHGETFDSRYADNCPICQPVLFEL